MRTLSLVLFSLSGILALENGSDNGGVGAAQMPDCAVSNSVLRLETSTHIFFKVNCIKEHVPNSGCDLLHLTCLCDPDFRTKHGPAIAPCLIVLCDANEINKVQNAWRGQCEEVPSTPEGKESIKSLVEEHTSAASVVSASCATTSSDVTAQSLRTELPNILARVLVEKALIPTAMISMQKLAPRLTPLSTPRRTPTPTTSSSTSSETSSSTSSSTPRRTPTPTPTSTSSSTSSSTTPASESETESTGSTSTSTTQKSIPTPTPARTPGPNSNHAGQGLTTGAKVGIGVGVSFGVVGMACLAATLWLRTREKAPPVTLRQEIQDVGKDGLSPPTCHPLQVSEIDGREAPRELPA